MNCTEFKQRVSELFDIVIPKEIERFKIMSNKRLANAGVKFKNFTTDTEIKQGWITYNKKEAEWENYCRKVRHENKIYRYCDEFIDFSDTAYNNHTDDL